MSRKVHNTTVHIYIKGKYFILGVNVFKQPHSLFRFQASYACIVPVAGAVGVACGTLTRTGGVPTLESSLVMSFSHMVLA